MSTTAPSPPWSDLLPELLGHVIAHLPFPGDCARFRAVCRSWHAAARQHVARQLPWIMLPDGSFCTIGGGGGGAFHRPMAGLPPNATCLGGTGDWLALDCCADDAFRRRTHPPDNKFLRPRRRDVRHGHAYSLHNPFSGETVPLPELDSIAETFEIRRVVMRSGGPGDLVAVVTNNWNHPVILCRPGKGRFVIPCLNVFDVAFSGGALYGLAPDDDLIAFDLAEDDGDGAPVVTKFKRVIKHPLAEGEEELWSWLDDYNYYYDDDDEELSSGSSDEASNGDEPNHPEEDEDDEGFDGDGMVLSCVVRVEDKESPDEDTKGVIEITPHLVEWCGGELLLVKHHVQVPSWLCKPYTRKVEVFKADIDAGKWIPVTGGDALAGGEALFLGPFFSKAIRVYGDLKEGFMYFAHKDDVFDTVSWAIRPFSLPPQRKLVSDDELMTWLFPPEIVV